MAHWHCCSQPLWLPSLCRGPASRHPVLLPSHFIHTIHRPTDVMGTALSLGSGQNRAAALGSAHNSALRFAFSRKTDFST